MTMVVKLLAPAILLIITMSVSPQSGDHQRASMSRGSTFYGDVRTFDLAVRLYAERVSHGVVPALDTRSPNFLAKVGPLQNFFPASSYNQLRSMARNHRMRFRTNPAVENKPFKCLRQSQAFTLVSGSTSIVKGTRVDQAYLFDSDRAYFRRYQVRVGGHARRRTTSKPDK